MEDLKLYTKDDLIDLYDRGLCYKNHEPYTDLYLEPDFEFNSDNWYMRSILDGCLQSELFNVSHVYYKDQYLEVFEIAKNETSYLFVVERDADIGYYEFDCFTHKGLVHHKRQGDIHQFGFYEFYNLWNPSFLENVTGLTHLCGFDTLTQFRTLEKIDDCINNRV